MRARAESGAGFGPCASGRGVGAGGVFRNACLCVKPRVVFDVVYGCLCELRVTVWLLLLNHRCPTALTARQYDVFQWVAGHGGAC